MNIEIPDGRSIEIEYDGKRYDEDNNLRVNLNKYETLHLKADNTYADWTGMYISGTNPIAAFSGATSIQVKGE